MYVKFFFQLYPKIFRSDQEPDKILLHGSKMCGSIILIGGERKMASEEYKARKAAYVKRYQKETYTNISFKVRTVKDKDILDILNSVPNKSLFLKELIRNAKLPK